MLKKLQPRRLEEGRKEILKKACKEGWPRPAVNGNRAAGRTGWINAHSEIVTRLPLSEGAHRGQWKDSSRHHWSRRLGQIRTLPALQTLDEFTSWQYPAARKRTLTRLQGSSFAKCPQQLKCGRFQWATRNELPTSL